MKKLPLIMTLTALCYTTLLYAEEPANEADTPSNTVQSDQPRVMPTPQASRIDGLIERLSTNYAHEIETLSADGEEFLALLRQPATNDPQGCVILLHGDHGHPDWPQVISPLRQKLPQHSWCTLAIEIPDVGGRATPVMTPAATAENQVDNSDTALSLPNEDTVFARIDAAIEFTRAAGYGQEVFLGYRTGAAYALRYTSERNIMDQALVLIEPRTVAPVSEYELAQMLQTLNLPVLDYYFNRTSRDQRFAQWRQAAANQRANQQDRYRQIDALPDARYDPVGDKRLVQRVWGFLKQNTTQQRQRKELPEYEKDLFYESPLDEDSDVSR
ncbi:DUF3530 family protein [Marinomonas ostreistagni]|uniref:DUF3530 family protein n=1 Tax=Marinomonas ostreistagni TaxID=359209 RepID=UPI001951E7CC|nr:DUF3530 family protein [Marinomonas ostreistagni]MBM6551512.1 alpha/beta hydrolase family protein [Marinomonas ostreistagni]